MDGDRDFDLDMEEDPRTPLKDGLFRVFSGLGMPLYDPNRLLMRSNGSS